MPKFTPRVEAKNPVLHDASAKKHITFDLSDSEEKPDVKKLKVEPNTQTKQSKKRIHESTKQQRKKIKVDNGSTEIVIEMAQTQQKKETAPAATNTVQADVLQKVQELRKKKKEKRKAKKLGANAPAFQLLPEKLTKKLSTEDLREYILYCLTEAPTPDWMRIANRAAIEKLVLVFAQGLDLTFFGFPPNRANIKSTMGLTDLGETDLAKETLQDFNSLFSHCVVTKVSGTKGKIHNPLMNLLQCPVSNSQKEKRDKERKSNRDAANTPEYYILKHEDMVAAEYPIPTCLDSSVALPEGWHETRPGKDVQKKKLVAVDCEMCETASGMALARVSLIDEGKLRYSTVILDELVLPDEPITNYLTEYSGITPEMMANTTTSLRRAQKHVRKFVDHDVILVGHGLHNDLKALKLTHPYCIDTSIIYHHTRGPPFRPGLKWLSSRYLKRDIQNTDPNHGGRIGHDPREDATATLDLVKLKIQKGATFGLLHDNKELIFHRIKRFRPPRHGAIVESAEQPNKLLSAALGKDYVNCSSDDSAAQKTIQMLAEKDFILCKWAVLETVHKGDAPTATDNGIPTVIAAHGSNVSNEKAHAIESLNNFNKQFKSLYDQLPLGTAVVVMGGLGDLRAVQKLTEKQDRYQAMFKKHKLSNIPEEEQFSESDQKRLEQEAAKAQMGSAFFCIKGPQ
ncbi:hypothetical protein INT43_003660, partial [Umbelopsis isabellina]